MNPIDQFLAGTLHRAQRINRGMGELRPLLAPVLPFRGNDLEELPLDVRIASVALLKRFEQLQDMLARLARAILSWHAVDVPSLTQRDVANWMEKMHFVDDADDWMELAKLRNRLVHEYPIEESEQVLRVNLCWASASELSAILTAAERHLIAQGFSQ